MIEIQRQHSTCLWANMLNSNIFSTCPHNSGWDRLASLGHPSKLQRVSSRFGFVTAATSLNGSQPNFARCLAVSWAGTFWHIPLGGSCLLTELCHVQISLCVQVLRSPWQRYCTALQQLASAKLCGVVQRMELRNFRRRCHLYSAGRPSRWASAHILVCIRLCHWLAQKHKQNTL